MPVKITSKNFINCISFSAKPINSVLRQIGKNNLFSVPSMLNLYIVFSFTINLPFKCYYTLRRHTIVPPEGNRPIELGFKNFFLNILLHALAIVMLSRNTSILPMYKNNFRIILHAKRKTSTSFLQYFSKIFYSQKYFL